MGKRRNLFGLNTLSEWRKTLNKLYHPPCLGNLLNISPLIDFLAVDLQCYEDFFLTKFHQSGWAEKQTQKLTIIASVLCNLG